MEYYWNIHRTVLGEIIEKQQKGIKCDYYYDKNMIFLTYRKEKSLP